MVVVLVVVAVVADDRCSWGNRQRDIKSGTRKVFHVTIETVLLGGRVIPW